MELRQIQYFVQLYKDRNITKASQTLFISQQGLSKSIAKLEKELGFSLFERSASGATPTEAAEELYPYFEQVLSSYSELSLKIDQFGSRHSLKIAAPDGFSLACDKDEFSEYSLLYPDVEISYKEYANHTLSESLTTRQADVAFMIAPIPDNLQSYLVVAKDPFCAIMDSRHPLAKKGSLSIEDLAQQSLLFLNGYMELNKLIQDQLNTLGFSYQTSISTVNEFLQTIYASPLIGFGLKKLFQHFNFPEIVFLPFTAMDHTELFVECHLVGLKDLPPSREIQKYIDYEKNTHPQN